MKIRTGFVSNSSSTSFCIVGIERRSMDVFKEEFGVHPGEVEDYSIGLEYYRQDEYYPVYLGIDIGCMKDEQTLGEFKQKAREILKEVLGKDVEVSLLHHGWYAG